MRAGEVCGLQWRDLDLDRGSALVQRTWSRQRLGPTKTGHVRGVSILHPIAVQTDGRLAPGQQSRRSPSPGRTPHFPRSLARPGRLHLRFARSPALLDGSASGVAARPSGGEGALQVPRATQTHVREHDAVPQTRPCSTSSSRAAGGRRRCYSGCTPGGCRKRGALMSPAATLLPPTAVQPVEREAVSAR